MIIVHYFLYNHQVKESLFNHSNSGSEFGTCRWAMNVLRSTNAKKGPHDAFNAYSEYNDKELDRQILAIAMTYFGMENVDGKRNIGCLP